MIFFNVDFVLMKWNFKFCFNLVFIKIFGVLCMFFLDFIDGYIMWLILLVCGFNVFCFLKIIVFYCFLILGRKFRVYFYNEYLLWVYYGFMSN